MEKRIIYLLEQIIKKLEDIDVTLKMIYGKETYNNNITYKDDKKTR